MINYIKALWNYPDDLQTTRRLIVSIIIGTIIAGTISILKENLT